MEKIYITILSFIRKNNTRENFTITFCKYIPYVTAISYIFTILYLLISKDSRIIPSLLKPLAVVLVVTVFRKLINRPRPYDTLNIQPLFKHKKGESFPSRHTASAFIIALVCFTVNPIPGSLLIITASLVAITRIIAGVHYPSDVLVAIIIAFLGMIF